MHKFFHEIVDFGRIYVVAPEAIPLYALVIGAALFQKEHITNEFVKKHAVPIIGATGATLAASTTALFNRGREFRDHERQANFSERSQQLNDMDSFFKQGEELFNNEKYQEAKESFEDAKKLLKEVLDANSQRKKLLLKYRDCIYRIAQCSFYLKDFPYAIDLLTSEINHPKVTSLDPSTLVRYLNLRAIIYMHEDNYKNALQDLSRSHSMNKRQTAVYLIKIFLEEDYRTVTSHLSLTTPSAKSANPANHDIFQRNVEFETDAPAYMIPTLLEISAQACKHMAMPATKKEEKRTLSTNANEGAEPNSDNAETKSTNETQSANEKTTPKEPEDKIFYLQNAALFYQAAINCTSSDPTNCNIQAKLYMRLSEIYQGLHTYLKSHNISSCQLFHYHFSSTSNKKVITKNYKEDDILELASTCHKKEITSLESYAKQLNDTEEKGKLSLYASNRIGLFKTWLKGKSPESTPQSTPRQSPGPSTT